MLDWLKDILGEAYTDEVDKAVSKKIGEGFVARTDFNTLNDTVKTLKDTISERDGQLEALKEVDAKGLQDEIKRLQEENKTASDNFQKALEQMKFETALDKALLGAKAKNPKAVKALLNSESIKLDGETLLGLDDQLKSLKESDSYLFEIEQKKQEGTGTNRGGGGKPPENEPKTVAEKVTSKLSNLFNTEG